MPYESPDPKKPYSLQQLVQFQLVGRGRASCTAAELIRDHPEMMKSINTILKDTYGVEGEQLYYQGHGGTALVVSTGDGQVIRFSSSSEPRRIKSEYVLKNHVPMEVVPVPNHYLKIEIAGFPHVPTLGEKIDEGAMSKLEANSKYLRLHNALTAQGYNLSDGMDINVSIPRENIGVYDNGELTVLDAGMYTAHDVDINQFSDGSREPVFTPKNIGPELEKGEPIVSPSQREHMKNRGLVMGVYNRSSRDSSNWRQTVNAKPQGSSRTPGA